MLVYLINLRKVRKTITNDIRITMDTGSYDGDDDDDDDEFEFAQPKLISQGATEGNLLNCSVVYSYGKVCHDISRA